MSQSERRKTLRMGLSLPVRVQGFNPDGTTWEEITTTDDVSQGGVSFTLKRPLDLGQVLLLTLPLPKRLLQYDLTDASYRVYALIRGMAHRPDQSRVGAMFFGKYPPRGFHENPSARYLLPTDTAATLKSPPAVARTQDLPRLPTTAPPPRKEPAPLTTGWDFVAPIREAPQTPPLASAAPPPVPAVDPSERRKSPRVERFVNFLLQQVDEFGAVLQEELTVAENVSKGGARVISTLAFMKGDIVLVQHQEAGGGFASRAEVRDLNRGRDGVFRLHLKFLDREAPERLMRG